MNMRPIVVVVALAALSMASAATLEAELQVPLHNALSWAQDLAVDATGNMYVLGRNGDDTGYAVWKYAPSGSLTATLAVETLSTPGTAPGRITVTASGRIVISEICWTAECRAALLVFSPAGSLEREIVTPRGTIIQLVGLGGERIAAATHELDDTFHFDLHTVDVGSGVIESSATGFVSSLGVNKLYTQRALDEDNCLRDLYVTQAHATDHVVAGYSGRNAFGIYDLEGNLAGTFALTAFSPRSLSLEAQSEEQQAQDIAVTQGRIYNQDTTCGFFSGLSIDEEGRTVVTGRGIVEGRYQNELYDTGGTLVEILESPFELNHTLAFVGGKAFGICNVGSNTWALLRFRIVP
ncbi:MAG: hypothetical protein Q9Q13_13515 [Acidobacteriota bacterium]|nr:hypothetical protein [Acidobacteriota bacterium]